jgi:hypothetical protein
MNTAFAVTLTRPSTLISPASSSRRPRLPSSRAATWIGRPIGAADQAHLATDRAELHRIGADRPRGQESFSQCVDLAGRVVRAGFVEIGPDDDVE